MYDKLHFYFGLREPQASLGVQNLQAEVLEACKRNNVRCILSYTMKYQFLLEKNLLPGFLIRVGIRQLLRQRLQEENKGSAEEQKKHLLSLMEELKHSPIAVETNSANEQHYEVPTEFYQLCLGKHLKYSSCFYKEGVANLDTAEEAMLQLTCERAELKDGMDILELGCGWGSLSLFMAEKFPNSKVIAISNSRTQKTFIDNAAKKRGITNLSIITDDINSFSTDKQFDRIVSVEMFEHLRNYEQLFANIASWKAKPSLRGRKSHWFRATEILWGS